MKLSRRHVLQFAGAAVAGFATPPMAWAQAYPARPVRVIATSSAGGTSRARGSAEGFLPAIIFFHGCSAMSMPGTLKPRPCFFMRRGWTI